MKEDFDLEAAKSNIWIGAMDMAGNYFERTLVDIKNKGKVTFELVGPAGDENYPRELPVLYYPVKELNKETNKVEEKWYYTTDTTNLSYGVYEPDYNGKFSEYDFSFEPENFTLDDNNYEQKVKVIFTKNNVDDYGILNVYISNVANYHADNGNGIEIELFAVDKKTKTRYKIPRKASYARDS